VAQLDRLGNLNLVVVGAFKLVFRPVGCIYSQAKDYGFMDTKRVSKAESEGIFLWRLCVSSTRLAFAEQDPKGLF
jgi:hypothetical protein